MNIFQKNILLALKRAKFVRKYFIQYLEVTYNHNNENRYIEVKEEFSGTLL